ncbi:MAG TPA: Crp/Fnr family transcriptional regulator [Bacteroidales bacterium]|nr:MAG: hypothetical protein A2X11_16505 [Bacteroidetes bacterium GWE2_42_24]OFY26351.1 MAG: hypothetical protein A2X09_00190 [Bacteroidetes bacterium GWF2_43_11]HAQ65588.1 Crp/Fnr family transcriptional regulator [Bacteroidales bacterium]HBZ66893.1 Crp/Fnr family transcriptional regulator [Bacteroidales bacterium]
MKTIHETDKEFVCDIQASCFQLLLPEEVDLVRTSKTQVAFRKGEIITKQGAFASYVMFVISGVAKQYVENDQGKNFNFQIVKTGDFVGLSAVFTKMPFNYSTVALTNCQVFLIANDAIANVVRHNGAFGFNLIKRYCEKNGSLLGSLRTVLYKQMNGRMAETLLYLDGFRENDPDIFQLLTRREIGDFAFVSAENAVKLLKSFERDGLIELKGKDIFIVDREKLTEISHRG